MAFLGGRPSLTSPVLTGFCKTSVNLGQSENLTPPPLNASFPLTFQPMPVFEVNKWSLSRATWDFSQTCLHFTAVLFHFFLTFKLNPVTKHGDIHSESKYHKTKNNVLLIAVQFTICPLQGFIQHEILSCFKNSHVSIKTIRQNT